MLNNPTIVSLIDSFILKKRSNIIGREWEMKQTKKSLYG
jgi:hypothetical protein